MEPTQATVLQRLANYNQQANDLEEWLEGSCPLPHWSVWRYTADQVRGAPDGLGLLDEYIIVMRVRVQKTPLYVSRSLPFQVIEHWKEKHQQDVRHFIRGMLDSLADAILICRPVGMAALEITEPGKEDRKKSGTS